MNTCFISDLHLQASTPDLTNFFLEFLQQFAGKIKALYILGDFFEFWIGDDDSNEFHTQIINALNDFAKQTPIYFMHGNRDFLIGNRFANQANCKLIADPSIIDLYDKATLLAHGDGLCTNDHSHIRFRKIVRTKLFQIFFLSIPLKLRKYIGEKFRQRSMQRLKSLSTEIMDVHQEEIIRQLKKYKVKQIFHGHTHRPAIEYLQVNQQWCRRVVLSDWHKQSNILICKPDGSVELVYGF